MDSNDKGEHSRKNESQDEEKPLKKARYLWEVKGKGHLKNSLPDNNNDYSEGPSEANQEKPEIVQPTNSSESCCRQFFLSTAENIMIRDSSDEDESEKLPLENSIENEIPVTLVSAQPKNHDYYLKKWQARQIARGFVDNTINSMLENWIDRPFDPSSFVDDCENDGQVEDDAILMAIQSHGLQSGLRGPSHNSTMMNSLFSSNSNSSVGSNIAIAGSSRSESRTDILATNNNCLEPAIDNLVNIQKEQENESSVGSTSSSMSVDTTSSISNPYEAELGDPMDFLNAAVAVAIQKKGLTY